MLAPLKALSQNLNIFVLLVLASFVGGGGGDVFMKLEIFLVLGLTSVFLFCFVLFY